MNSTNTQILVVDDNPVARYAVTRVLQSDGHAVVEVGTGRQALELARSMRPELMVLDVRLPDILGFDVTERLRADPATRSMAILQLSASLTRADAQAEGLRRGADAYLTSPLDPQVLSATVEALLRMRRAEQREREARARAEESKRRYRLLAADARARAQQREQLIEELRKEAQRRDEFLAVLSHELRNPLMPIRNSIFVLERSEVGEPRAARALEVIARQSEHMRRLIEDLLEITRIARGKAILNQERVELNELVWRAIEDHREQFRSAALELEATIPEQPVVVDGDPTRLAQLIGNLLGNASKFTPAGGHVWVSLAADASGAAVLRVRDDGAGIREEHLNHLFEPFAQADSTLGRSQGGLGLGLALARGVAELHGGSIRAESAGPGRGAEFIVTLPQELRPTSRPPAERMTRRSGSRRILVVEDNCDAAQMLEDALELCGHQVEVAHTGAEGIAKARALVPEVILCDIGLPDLDGYEVARQLRSDPELRPTALIALSGYAFQYDIERAKDAGFDRHLAKPADLDELERLLAETSPS